MASNRIPIRNLSTLASDMIGELRQVLHAIYDYEREMPIGGPPEDVERLIATTEAKVRNVLEYITGSRE